jgi:hypothetical protein
MKHKHPIGPIIKMREQKLIDILGYFSQVWFNLWALHMMLH